MDWDREWNGMGWMGGGVNDLTLLLGAGSQWRGATQNPKIYNKIFLAGHNYIMSSGVL